MIIAMETRVGHTPQPGNIRSVRTYHSMIEVLHTQRRSRPSGWPVSLLLPVPSPQSRPHRFPGPAATIPSKIRGVRQGSVPTANVAPHDNGVHHWSIVYGIPVLVGS